jgi:hypothetical protein
LVQRGLLIALGVLLIAALGAAFLMAAQRRRTIGPKPDGSAASGEAAGSVLETGAAPSETP